ncbi:MAG: CusA/CzcA family heavy metal efflux RND transporter, partial [Candidatus Eisenbacteria bacterium]|nr:CusA/CzcA family heavy metal efflux RND transporter [Candidatus Latescibacterota bacterium]MBD3303022.1 CusA/CzcA family heavy metal efflux RND transporter [Candidatus Eisenbacteria bacterium]
VLHTVRENLLGGAFLVIAVLLAFLGELRAGLIVASVIPLSFLFAGTMMHRMGIAGTLMSFGALDFGLIVDSSVILVENAARRLREAPIGAKVTDVVRRAAVEVRRPTLFGELIIMIVYLPILTLEGIEGKLFRPMALTVIFALVGSMILSLTLMPAISSLILRRGRQPKETLLLRGVRRLYRPVLGWALGNRAWVLAAAAALVIGGGILGLRLGSVFVPRLSEGSIVFNTVHATGITLEEAVRLSARIETLLLERFPDEIEHVWSRTGTAEVATDPMGIELTDTFLMLHPREEWTRAETQEELVGRIEAELADLPGMRMVFTQPIEMRINEMVSGIRSDVGIKLFGDDLDLLKEKADEIAGVVSGIPGAADVVVEQVTGQPILEIRPDPDRLGRHGIASERVLDAVEAIGGAEAGQIRDGQRRFAIAVWLGDRYRTDADALATVPIAKPGGGTVPLGDLAAITRYEGPATITREWSKRRIVVQANARGRDVGSFVEEAQEAVAEQVVLPAGMFVRWGGQFEHLIRARNRMAVVVPIALLSILLLLYVTYGRWRDALRVFTGVPFAAVGGVIALALRDMPFSISAAVGFVALSGVAVLGDMVLVSFIRQELDRGRDVAEAVRAAAETRLRPVLMTGLVASLGFLPMALNTGIGAEVQRPLATVVVGGMLSSTVLTLVVLPVLFVALRRGTGRPDPRGSDRASAPGSA